MAVLHRFYLYLLPFKCLPDDFAWIISRKNFRISAVPFSIILTGGNSRGLLVIFNPFNVLISPEIYLEKFTIIHYVIDIFIQHKIVNIFLPISLNSH